MKGVLKYSFAIFMAMAVFVLIFSEKKTVIIKGAENFLGAIFFVDSITEGQIKAKYEKAAESSLKVRILVVPGHDDDFWGAGFQNLREADLNLELGEKIYGLLKNDERLEVLITRDKNGYLKEFSDYFKNQENEIKKFRDDNMALMRRAVETNVVANYDGVPHNNASDEVGVRLYGINKWANENRIDIVLHIHFNDDGARKWSRAGDYSGFAIYIPERQLSNAKASAALAKAVFPKMAKYFPVSNMPEENTGIVPEQDLIAIGAKNTLDAAAMVIEYGYIYEPQISGNLLRSAYMKELAFQTYAGIENFFGKTIENKYQTTLLPYDFKNNFGKNYKSKDILSLQAALINENIYPPSGSSLNDCPMSGMFGDCTESALKVFQEKNAINPPTGFLGELTRSKLNEIYSK